MKLYNSNFSPNALRARAVVHQLELSPEIVEIDVSKGENRTEQFLAISPMGKVPALVDEDLTLFESRAIMTYLARKAGSALYPKDPVAAGKVDQWSFWQAIHFGPAMQKLTFERVQKAAYGRGEPDEGTIVGDLKTTLDGLAILNLQIDDAGFAIGPLTVVDFSLASTFMLREPARISLEPFRNVQRWIDRIEALPSWQKALVPWLADLERRGVAV
jgi:glutathione S-transferase